MHAPTLSRRAFATILPVALLLFGLATWFAYHTAREREMVSSMQLLGQDRRVAQQELVSRFDELALVQGRARDRVITFLRQGQPPLSGFDRYFPPKGDGTRRSADSLWDGTQTEMGSASGFGAFIGPADLTPQRRQVMSAAFASMVGLVEGLPTNVNNLYFFTPDNDLLMHAPGRSDRLEFYRRTAPATLDFQAEEFSRIVTPQSNPDGSMRCTSLRPILYDRTRTTWTTGCMTPVRVDGRQIGAFGSSIPLDEIFSGDAMTAAPGIARVIVTTDGKLVRHPDFTIQNTTRTGRFLDLTQTGKPALKELWATLRQADSGRFNGYLPVSDIYVNAERLGRPDWYVISMISGDVLRERAFAAARPVLLTGLLATAAFGLFIVIFIRRQLITPITQLAERADLVSLGSEQVDGTRCDGGDELARLNRAFDAMESRVTRERLRLTRSFDQMADAIEEYAILLLDPAGLVIRANRAAKQQFGWHEDSGLDQIWTDPDKARAELDALLIGAAAQNGVSQSVLRARADGSTFWAFEAIEPVRDTQEGLVGFAYIGRDATVQKDAETDILAARDKATREAEMRRDLLATMSHEIRTPMTGILGMLEQVRRGNSARARDRALASIENSAGALMRVLDDVLHHAKAESGTLAIEERAFDTTQVLQNAAELFLPLAKRKGLAMDLRTGPRERLLGDPMRIQQILANFLSNAIKFTESGRVTLACLTEQIEGGRVSLTLSVSDTGIGIPADRIEALFAPFEQASTDTERKFGGTGLGLAICRKLAQAMGGVVEVETVEGGGSTFLLRLALPRADAAKDALPGQGKRALVLLRSATIALSTQACLEELGFTVHRMAHATDGIAWDQFDLAFCDGEFVTGAGMVQALREIQVIVVGSAPGDGLGIPSLKLPVTTEAIAALLHEARP